MQRKLAHEDRDVEKRAETAQVPQIALVRRATQSLDVGLEVKRRAVYVPNTDGAVSDSEGMDGPWWYRGGVACP